MRVARLRHPACRKGVTMRFIHYTQSNGRSASPVNGSGDRVSRQVPGTELDWLFGTALTGFAGVARTGQFPVDLFEDKENTYVRAELPGVARDAISIEVVDDALSIQASRKASSGEGNETFSRLVSIPDGVQADKATASYVDGVLTVTLPRKEEAKPRKIDVSVN
jgi:HSP20 family protein